MSRKQLADAALDALCDQRDHVAIQVSLAWDAEPADLIRLSALQRRLRSLDEQILAHKPANAADKVSR